MVQWKTISHIPLASYVMHPIVTQHVMYVYISMFTTIKQGSKISGVFPKHFRHKKKLCQVSEGVVVLHNLCPWKACPKGTSSLKQNDWNRGPLGIWRVSILPQSHPRNPPQQKFANKSLAPGNMTSQQSRPPCIRACATLRFTRSMVLASESTWGPRPETLGVVPQRLGGWGPLAEPPDGPKEPTKEIKGDREMERGRSLRVLVKKTL